MTDINIPLISVSIDRADEKIKQLNRLIHRYPKEFMRAMRITTNNLRKAMAKSFGTYKNPTYGITLTKKDAITKALDGKKKSVLGNFRTIKIKAHGSSMEVGYIGALAPYVQRFQSGVPRHLENQSFRHTLYILLNSRLRRNVHDYESLLATIPQKSPKREVVETLANYTAKRFPHQLLGVFNSIIERSKK